MDTTFEIGEIVVCVNAKRRWYRLGGLKKGEMYTVVGFNPYDNGLVLKEAKSPRSGCNAYRADRFRKADYAFADRILNTIKPQKQEKLPVLFEESKSKFAATIFTLFFPQNNNKK